MKLHYKGKYDLKPESLPHGEHMPGAVKFKEASDMKQLSLIANGMSVIITILLIILAFIRCRFYIKEEYWQILLGCVVPLLTLFPHELLHAVCFKKDVYLYTNLSQGILFVVGPETMSKGRFIFMSLLPNLMFGIIPYIIGMVCPKLVFFLVFGALSAGMGAGDYYNVFNAATQMPKGARTYLYQFNSYWYMPEE
ncbi:MAG: DUF3267 domain-containing protein [Schaedlerella sp.]|nr:DUF3267 domain-containing protein [Lachnospiraceae bacterium]MDY4202038.1 DUF3267 domain-containing protein [Schaedlerella sp.]